MSLPSFSKDGAVYATPSWMTTASVVPFYAQLIDFDAYRSFLPSLPEDSYGLFGSSDHASTTGYWWLATSDSIDGPWTDSGAAVHSGANQLETPAVFFDFLNQDRFLVCPHLSTSNGGDYNDQHTEVFETVDFETFTQVEANPLDFPHQHGGYAHLWQRNNEFVMKHSMTGGEMSINGRSTSENGEDFTFDGWMNLSPNHVVGRGNTLGTLLHPVQINGQWYVIATFQNRPKSTGIASNLSIIAVPIDYSSQRPTGGYYTLISRSVTTTDPDYRINSSVTLYQVGDTLKLFYTGETSTGTRSICSATATLGVGTSTYTAPQITNIRSNGSLRNGTDRTLFLDWDAANDALPSALTITAASGTNASSQSAGNYYSLQSGTGTSDLRLDYEAAIDPAAYEAIEWSIYDLTLTNNAALLSSGFHWRLQHSYTNPSGVVLTNGGSGGLAGGQGGRMRVQQAGSTTVDESAYAYPFQTDSQNVCDLFRENPHKLTFRIQDYGDTFLILLDDQVVYYLDTSAISWGTNPIPGMRVVTASTYMRFTRYTLEAWNPSPLIGGQFVGNLVRPLIKPLARQLIHQ